MGTSAGDAALDALLAARGWTGQVPFLAAGLHQPLLDKVAALRAAGHEIYPPQGDIFAALTTTAWDSVRVLIVGQDPYPNPGQAHGLAFSVREGVAAPRSLQNIFKEIARDLGPGPAHGPSAPPAPPASPASRGGTPSPCLSRWAEQGVLLLNAVLTVEAGQAHSHQHLGWQALTSALLAALAARPAPLAVLLWGNAARLHGPLFREGREQGDLHDLHDLQDRPDSHAPQARAAQAPLPAHLVLEAAHPSPLSASRGFHGCGHFSAVNRWLQGRGQAGIDW